MTTPMKSIYAPYIGNPQRASAARRGEGPRQAESHSSPRRSSRTYPCPSIRRRPAAGQPGGRWRGGV